MSPLYAIQADIVAGAEAGATLIGAPPGTGKTLMAIELARRLGAHRILVTCPAIAQGVWLAEVQKWWPEARAVLLRDLVNSKASLSAEPTFIVTSFDFLVVNERAREITVELEFDLGVVDESHSCKNPAAKRTRLLYGPRCAGDGLLDRCARVLLLTGTPTPNGHPSEIWPAVRRFRPDLIEEMDYGPYCRRYCVFTLRQVQTRHGTKTIEQISGASAKARDLARRLAQEPVPFWIRPPRDVVDAGLPPLRMVTRELPIEAIDADALRQIEDHPDAQKLRNAIEDDDLRHVEAHLSRLRRLIALTKIEPTAAWIEGAFAEGEVKVCCWGWHTEPLEQLRAALAEHRPLLITGATSQRDRDAAVAAFQEDPSRRVFIGQIAAAGQAITLTAARRAVFLEMAWTPAQNWQALKRCHRISQHRAVLGEALCIPRSVDTAVQAMLVRKAHDIKTLETAA